jgi:choice-of-anchor B domain-containing protein
MKLKCLLLLAFFAGAGLIKAQYPAQNFTLQSVTDPEAGTGFKYSACWGWTQPGTGREYAIACSKNGTYWVDVTNPFTPTVCAYKPGTSSNGTWREVKTYGNYAYVVCDDGGSTGFQIFDMSTLPATVTLVSSNQTLFRRGHAAWVDGNKLYVSGITYSTGSSPASSALNVYSLATPTAPVLLRRLQQDYGFISYVHDAFVRNDTVYASCGNQGLYVFKLTSTNTFTMLGSLTTYTASGYNHSSALTPNGQTLVFMDEVPESLPIKVANVTNLSNIQVLATMNQYSLTTPHNPFVVSNQYVFVAAYQDGTQLFDISNPNSPFLAGYFDTHPQTGGNVNNYPLNQDYNGQWGCYPFFKSRNIFGLDEQNGIFMFNTHLYSLPEIAVSGLGNNIPDGSSVTSPTNNTNYSTVNLGSAATHTFIVQNFSLAVMNVTSITLTGGGAADFSLLTPAVFTVAPSGSVAIAIQFSPTATGNRSVQVTINNDDLNEAVFDFVINGNGNSPLNLKKSGSADEKFAFFPNPAKNEVEFNMPSGYADKELRLKVYDATGKLVCERSNADMKLSGNNRKVNLQELSNGLYYADLISGNETIVSERLIISR